MLNSNITLFSFEAKSNKTSNSSNALLLKECNVYGFSDVRVYSEFDELSIDVFNRNDYGFGLLEIEFVLENDLIASKYPEYYTKCFVIRTDTGVLIKPMKFRNNTTMSKVNSNGHLVISVGYYFDSQEQVDMIMQCKALLVEGFIALDKPKNVYGIMCQLSKASNSWVIDRAYTYKPKHAKNIKYLID